MGYLGSNKSIFLIAFPFIIILVYCVKTKRNGMVRSYLKSEVCSSLDQLIRLFKAAVDSGVTEGLSAFQGSTIYINKVEAYRRYGRSSVDRWLQEKLIKCCSIGKKKNSLKLLELEEIASKSNRVSYLEVCNR